MTTVTTTADSTCASTSGVPLKALSWRRVSKKYGHVLALDDIELSIDSGESMALIGMNGAGKTSLLKIALDFVRADSGEIDLFGVSSRESFARNAVAFLPERFSPSPDLTGRQQLELVFGLHQTSASASQITETLEGLEFPITALNRKIREYSKGMVQKIGLCAVILVDKPLTVFDEPMSGLDPIARQSVQQALQQFRRRGRTVLFTTHALEQLPSLCDRLAVIHQGRLRFTGSPQSFLDSHGVSDIESAFVKCIDLN